LNLLQSVLKSRLRKQFAVTALLAAGVLLQALPAAAQHGARVSGSLQDHLNKKDVEFLRVIVQGPQSEVTRLAQTYGLTIIKPLTSGAVLGGSPDQVSRLSGDSNLASLVEDYILSSTMIVTTASTGASQMWPRKGSAYGGITGNQVGVALIDSGIWMHKDIQNRVGAVLDFIVAPGDPSYGVDEYGHGTHMAGIIAGSGGGSSTSTSAGYVGMAPGATIISEKVLDKNGQGYASDVIEPITVRYRHAIPVVTTTSPAR